MKSYRPHVPPPSELNQLRRVMLYDTSLQPIQPIQPQPIQPIQTQSIQSIQPQSIQPIQPQSIQPIQPIQTQSIQPVQPIQTQSIQSNDAVFRPALNQDPLFWCLYIMKHGAFKYEQIANRFTAEQNGKRDEVMALRECAKALKQSTGIKFTASTIEGDIMSTFITLHAFQVLVHLNSLNAVFVNPHNRVYAEFISDAVSNKPVYFIKRNDKTATRVSMSQATEAQLTTLRATHYRIENLQKPMKAVSAYTVAELTEMCHQLKIQLTPKMKKQELYDGVVKQLFL